MERQLEVEVNGRFFSFAGEDSAEIQCCLQPYAPIPRHIRTSSGAVFSSKARLLQGEQHVFLDEVRRELPGRKPELLYMLVVTNPLRLGYEPQEKWRGHYCLSEIIMAMGHNERLDRRWQILPVLELPPARVICPSLPPASPENSVFVQRIPLCNEVVLEKKDGMLGAKPQWARTIYVLDSFWRSLSAQETFV